jgi:hypothetical protein
MVSRKLGAAGEARCRALEVGGAHEARVADGDMIVVSNARGGRVRTIIAEGPRDEEGGDSELRYLGGVVDVLHDLLGRGFCIAGE